MGLLTSHGFGEYHAGEGHVSVMDRRWRPGGRLAIFAHGRGGTYVDALAPGQGQEAVRQLAGSGYLVLSAEFAGAAWGNDTAVARITEGINFAASRWGAATAKVTLVGASMGGLNVLNWARGNAAQVDRIALCVPVVDLADFHAGNRGGYAAEIEAAHGGAGPYAAAEAAHNPIASPGSYAGIPVRAWYASDDPLALPERVTAFTAAAAGSAISMGAVGHTVSWPPLDVARFLG